MRLTITLCLDLKSPRTLYGQKPTQFFSNMWMFLLHSFNRDHGKFESWRQLDDIFKNTTSVYFIQKFYIFWRSMHYYKMHLKISFFPGQNDLLHLFQNERNERSAISHTNRWNKQVLVTICGVHIDPILGEKGEWRNNEPVKVILAIVTHKEFSLIEINFLL